MVRRMHDPQTGMCVILDCINTARVVGAQGLEEIPHPLRTSCRPPVSPNALPPCVEDACRFGPAEHSRTDNCGTEELPKTPHEPAQLRGGNCAIEGCVVGGGLHLYLPERCRSRVGMARIEGVGPDTPTVTNERGASQSAIPYAFATMPHRALLSLGQLQAQGDAKYGPFNWINISVDDHINHAITHLFAYLAGDRSDQHLQHAAWRALAAHETELEERS